MFKFNRRLADVLNNVLYCNYFYYDDSYIYCLNKYFLINVKIPIFLRNGVFNIEFNNHNIKANSKFQKTIFKLISYKCSNFEDLFIELKIKIDFSENITFDSFIETYKNVDDIIIKDKLIVEFNKFDDDIESLIIKILNSQNIKYNPNYLLIDDTYKWYFLNKEEFVLEKKMDKVFKRIYINKEDEIYFNRVIFLKKGSKMYIEQDKSILKAKLNLLNPKFQGIETHKKNNKKNYNVPFCFFIDKKEKKKNIVGCKNPNAMIKKEDIFENETFGTLGEALGLIESNNKVVSVSYDEKFEKEQTPFYSKKVNTKLNKIKDHEVDSLVLWDIENIHYHNDFSIITRFVKNENQIRVVGFNSKHKIWDRNRIDFVLNKLKKRNWIIKETKKIADTILIDTFHKYKLSIKELVLISNDSDFKDIIIEANRLGIKTTIMVKESKNRNLNNWFKIGDNIINLNKSIN